MNFICFRCGFSSFCCCCCCRCCLSLHIFFLVHFLSALYFSILVFTSCIFTFFFVFEKSIEPLTMIIEISNFFFPPLFCVCFSFHFMPAFFLSISKRFSTRRNLVLYHFYYFRLYLLFMLRFSRSVAVIVGVRSSCCVVGVFILQFDICATASAWHFKICVQRSVNYKFWSLSLTHSFIANEYVHCVAFLHQLRHNDEDNLSIYGCFTLNGVLIP